MLAFAWIGRSHPKNLITQGGMGCLRALLKQGLQKSPRGVRFGVDRDPYSTPAMAASTASMSAPKSRPSEAAPAPGEALGQPGPFSWQSLGSLLTPSLRSRMPAASGDPTTMLPLGKDPRPLMIRFFSNLLGSK